MATDDTRWRPFPAERPEKSGMYTVTFRFNDGRLGVRDAYYSKNDRWGADTDDRIIAFRLLPSPYQPDAAIDEAAVPIATDPSTLPADVKVKLLAARDALLDGNPAEAYHQLYSIADPTFSKTYDGEDEPWDALATKESR